MLKLVYRHDSGSCVRKGVGVRVSPEALSSLRDIICTLDLAPVSDSLRLFLPDASNFSTEELFSKDSFLFHNQNMHNISYSAIRGVQLSARIVLSILLSLALMQLMGCERNKYPLAQVGKGQVNSSDVRIGKLDNRQAKVEPTIDPNRPLVKSTPAPKY